MTWNVNGLRAALGKGFGQWLSESDADVVCLQEIKARPDQLNPENRDFPGYQAIWNPAQRPGYSGVLTLLRDDNQGSQLGLGIDRFDIEGRVIRTRHPHFYLYNVYFPNGQRDLDRLSYKLDFYSVLLEICDKHHAAGENVIITGDFNTAHRPIDLRNPKQNEKNSGFLPEERAKVDEFLAHGFADIYRELYPERQQYTWWTYRPGVRERNVGWRIDYFLVSKSLLPQVGDAIIHDEVLGSDHCPVSLLIN